MTSDDRVVVEFDQHSTEYRETYPAKAHELRGSAGLEILDDPLREIRVPALGSDQLAGEVADPGERVARVGVERDVLAEEERVGGFAQDLLLGRLERAFAGGGDGLHEPAICLRALGGHLQPTVAVEGAGVTQLGVRPRVLVSPRLL